MRRTLLVVLLVVGVASSLAAAACTATFTADDSGTFAGALKYDRTSKLLTVDLSGIPKDAVIFRAELMLNGRRRFQRPPVEPTTVYPVGQPQRRLKFVAPRFVSLDALEVVREAVRAGQPLKLKLQTTLAGVRRLEVSYTPGRPRAANIPKVTSVKVYHYEGQSLIVFTEPKLESFPEFKTGGDVAAFKAAFLKRHPGMRFRIWRSSQRITPQSIVKAELVGECGFFSCWNGRYHQYATKKSSPVRYRVVDGGEPLPWGTGVYAHNPAKGGRAYYAVTVAVNGEEDLSALDAGNTTAEGVEEQVGWGRPILQWVEHPRSWMYRRGPLTRLIYTRWESWGPRGEKVGPWGATPHSSVPNNPIDYLVAMGDEPRPSKLPREGARKAYRVEPAPVGLHLHCWGGSLNGGYGWWYNAHRGAVLIASNQIPYDWWTGYHEARGTCKTYGDGYVWPFSMNRMFGFLEWATRQWKEAPESVRKYWRKLDLRRVFTAGSSMGGSGAPMYAIRFGPRVAWCMAWVGVHIPAESPGFMSSYRRSYGRRHPKITMPDGKTSPWDYFSDVWWLKHNIKDDTGFIMASNGKSDGGIGWPQAVKFARALQETRRPHLFNWGPGGHGTRTLIGSNFDLDIRTDQTLPAFTNCTLDEDIGTATRLPKAKIEELRRRVLARAKAAGKDLSKFKFHHSGWDGDERGAFNAHLWWRTDNIVDEPGRWEMTVILKATAPKDSCKVDLTPRRLQRFTTPRGKRFGYSVTDVRTGKVLATGTATADEYDLLTLRQIPLAKGENRVRITPAR